MLDENSIFYEIENDVQGYPDTLLGSDPSNKIILKIRQQDFSLVNLLVQRNDEEAIKSVSPDHYLFSFSDDELKEILEKADEWSSFDVSLAKRILKERGQMIPEQEIALKQQKRKLEMARPENAPLSLILTGFLFSLGGAALGYFLFLVIPGWFGNVFAVTLAGIGPAIGYAITWFKKMLPDGTKMYKYEDSDRKKGFAIFITGSVLAITLWMYILFLIFS